MSDSESTSMSRRDLLRRGTAAGIAVGGVSTGAVRLDHGPVQEAEAIAPAVAAGGIAASAATGWILRETEILGSNPPPEGQTPDALHNEIYNATRARKSNNQSTFVDNENIAQYADQAAYSAGKSAAFEAIEDQKTEQEVLDDAIEAADEHIATVQKNLLKSWNESVLEFQTYLNAASEHEETSQGAVFDAGDSGDFDHFDVYENYYTEQLANGEEIDLHSVYAFWEWLPDHQWYDYERDWNPVDTNAGGSGSSKGGYYVIVRINDYEDFRYLQRSDWSDVYSDITNIISEVRDGLQTWVEGIYGEVQSGEIDTSRILSASDRANMTTEDEGFAQAQADLQALNIPVDLEREAEIYVPDADATLYGQVSYTGDQSLSTGEVIPDEKDGVIYFTYDLAQGSGLWTEYQQGLDGGVLTLTAEPPSGYIFEIVTTQDETASFHTDDLESVEGAAEWTIDLSDQLEETIVDFELVVTTDQNTQYETTRLDQPFEINSFTDSEGNEYDEASFEGSEPHTDDNYISQEEWEESQERHEELIEKYEDAQSSGIAVPGAGDVLAGEANTFIGMVIVGAFAVVTVLSALNPLS